MKSINELQAPRSLSWLQTFRLRRMARKDAPNYLNKSPEQHTYTSKSLEAACQSRQEQIVQWRSEINAGLIAESKTVIDRIEARKVDLRDAESRLGDAKNERDASKKLASVYSYKAKLAEATSRLDALSEAITANVDLADSAIRTWHQFFDLQASVYLQALNTQIRKIDGSGGHGIPTQVVVPPFKDAPTWYNSDPGDESPKRTDEASEGHE